jgi:hypothetical protein
MEIQMKLVLELLEEYPEYSTPFRLPLYPIDRKILYYSVAFITLALLSTLFLYSQQ